MHLNFKAGVRVHTFRLIQHAKLEIPTVDERETGAGSFPAFDAAFIVLLAWHNAFLRYRSFTPFVMIGLL